MKKANWAKIDHIFGRGHDAAFVNIKEKIPAADWNRVCTGVGKAMRMRVFLTRATILSLDNLRALVVALGSARALETLSIENAGLGHDHLVAICDYVQRSRLTELSLSGNRFDDDSIEILCGLLRSVPLLQKLRLVRCALTDEHHRRLAEAIEENYRIRIISTGERKSPLMGTLRRNANLVEYAFASGGMVVEETNTGPLQRVREWASECEFVDRWEKNQEKKEVLPTARVAHVRITGIANIGTFPFALVLGHVDEARQRVVRLGDRRVEPGERGGMWIPDWTKTKNIEYQSLVLYLRPCPDAIANAHPITRGTTSKVFVSIFVSVE